MTSPELDSGPVVASGAGAYEARYLAFLETIATLRPALHRFCARMVGGSAADGEDLVQETLFHVYRRLDSFDETRPLKPWLFQIAHHRCVDFLRRRRVREAGEAHAAVEERSDPRETVGPELGRAVEHLVLALPPMERACVLLKDVLDHSLEESATVVGTTTGAVKAALHRGRAKLSTFAIGTHTGESPPARSPATAALLARYVERFNARDWDGVRTLVRADARVRVVDRFDGTLAESPYFGRYARHNTPWRLVLSDVDGEPTVVTEYHIDGAWSPRGIVRIQIEGSRISRIVDYEHCSWVLSAADVRVS